MPENVKPHSTNCLLLQITPHKCVFHQHWAFNMFIGLHRFPQSVVRKTTHLGCYKVGSIAGRHEEAIVCPELLGKTEITDAQRFWISRLINIKNITWLQVPVHNLVKKKNFSNLRKLFKSLTFSCIIHRPLQIYLPSLFKKHLYVPTCNGTLNSATVMKKTLYYISRWVLKLPL